MSKAIKIELIVQPGFQLSPPAFLGTLKGFMPELNIKKSKFEVIKFSNHPKEKEEVGK